MTGFYFFLGSLACWRIASLVANENGPAHIFRRFRDWVSDRVENHPRGPLAFVHFDELISCEWCNSIWIGTALAAVLDWHWLTILALSTMTIFIKYIIQTLEQVREYYERLNTSLKTFEGQNSIFMKEVYRERKNYSYETTLPDSLAQKEKIQ